MTKLITGGTGLIGSHFKDGIKVNSTDYNLLKEADVIKMYEDHRPDTVVHLAAKVGGLGANMNYLADFFYQNIMMNTQVIHHAREFGVKRMMCFTSTCVFPNEIEYPLTEGKIHLGPPHSSNYAYAYSKRMVEVQCRASNDQYGTNYFNVIPVNVYGSNDNFDLENSHVVPGLIHKVHLAMINDTDLTVWGSGNPLREFIYAKDIADISERLLCDYKGNDPVILTTSEETSIRDLTNLICDIFGFKNKIIFDGSKPDGQFRKPSSNEKLRSIIGDYKFTPLREGLEETIDWFKKTYPNIRK